MTGNGKKTLWSADAVLSATVINRPILKNGFVFDGRALIERNIYIQNFFNISDFFLTDLGSSALGQKRIIRLSVIIGYSQKNLLMM
jgi:hypothetical protein